MQTSNTHHHPTASGLEDFRISDIMAVIRRSKLRITLLLALSVIVAGVILALSKPSYKATATLILDRATRFQLPGEAQATNTTQLRAEDELSALLSQPVLALTASRSSAPDLPRDLFRSPASQSAPALDFGRLELQVMVEPDDMQTVAGVLRRVRGRPQVLHRLYARIGGGDATSPHSLRVRFLGTNQVEISEPEWFGFRDGNTLGPFDYDPEKAIAYAGLSIRLQAVGEYANQSYTINRISEDGAVRRLEARVHAQLARRDSESIEVIVTDSDPRRAAETANAICQNYIVLSRQGQQRHSERSAVFVEGQIEEQKALLARADEEVVALQASHPEAIDIPARSMSLINQFSALELERAQVQMSRDGIQEALAAMEVDGPAAIARLDKTLPDLMSITHIGEIARLISESHSLGRRDRGRYQSLLEEELVRINRQARQAQLNGKSLDVLLQSVKSGGPAPVLAVGSEGGINGSSPMLDPTVRQLLVQLADIDGQIARAQGALMEEHPSLLEFRVSRAALSAGIIEHLSALQGVLASNAESLRDLETAQQQLIAALPLDEKAAIESAVEALAEQVRVNLRTRLEGISTKLETLEQRAELLGDEIAALPQYEKMLAGPLRRRDTHTDLLKFLENTLQELNISRQAVEPMAELVSPAVSAPTRHSPRVALTLAFSTLMGLIMGIGLSVASVSANRVIRDEGAAERATGLASFGSFPSYSRRIQLPKLVTGELREPLRIIKANLSHALDHGLPVRILSVVSLDRSEGGALANVGLATALSAPGARVLLVDANQSDPSMHVHLGVPRGPGLEEALSGDVPWNEAVYPTEFAGLDVIPSGRANMGRSGLSQESLGDLLKELQSRYDLVVLHLAPIEVNADVHTMAPLVDAMVLLVATDRHESVFVGGHTRRMLQSGANLVGLIYNANCRSRRIGRLFGL